MMSRTLGVVRGVFAFAAVLVPGLLVALAAPAMAQEATPATRPAEQGVPARPATPTHNRVLIISVDGLRPDLLLRGDTPTLHGLLPHSAFTFWAKSTAVSITLPSHTSMLTGVQPQLHGIMWNEDLPLSEPIYPKFPTIFEVAHRAGYTTALVAGKSKFTTLAKPGTVDFAAIAKTSTSGDEDVASSALEILRDHTPDVMFVHFPGTDNAGHATGWGSPEYFAALAQIDRDIGEILKLTDDLKLTDRTYVIVSADHGGSGRTHGADDNRSRTIPWIIRGPGVRAGYDLTLNRPLEVKTEDTFATACYVLKLPLGRGVEGVPVMPAFSGGELLQAQSK
jgi:arylsulfatase A-like enzyme